MNLILAKTDQVRLLLSKLIKAFPIFFVVVSFSRALALFFVPILPTARLILTLLPKLSLRSF